MKSIKDWFPVYIRTSIINEEKRQPYRKMGKRWEQAIDRGRKKQMANKHSIRCVPSAITGKCKSNHRRDNSQLSHRQNGSLTFQ